MLRHLLVLIFCEFMRMKRIVMKTMNRSRSLRVSDSAHQEGQLSANSFPAAEAQGINHVEATDADLDALDRMMQVEAQFRLQNEILHTNAWLDLPQQHNDLEQL